MSWKSFVSAGLLCVLASPVFAQPTVQVVPGGGPSSGHLNAAGNWVWLIRISQSSPPVDIDGAGPIPAGSPLEAELGFTATGSALLDANSMSSGAGDDFDTPNPGAPIFGWEDYSDTNGDSVIDSTPPTDDEPVGLQSQCAGGLCTETGGANQVFATLGSVDYLSDTDGKDFIEIITDGPNTAQLSTTITMSGAYAGNGRIAELTVAPPGSANYDTFAGGFTRTASFGDANLDGTVDSTDLATLLLNFGSLAPGLAWNHGNFNNQTDAVVDSTDLALILANFGGGGPVGPGGGSGGGGAVPEPATMALLALAVLGAAGLRGRRS